jgi:hypothetical protein
MGYLAVALIGLVLLVALAVAASHNRKPKQGRISGDGTAILREQPSADEPTPARSATASQSEVRNAEKRTPPA